jgi:hypothetical protein
MLIYFICVYTKNYIMCVTGMIYSVFYFVLFYFIILLFVTVKNLMVCYVFDIHAIGNKKIKINIFNYF